MNRSFSLDAMRVLLNAGGNVQCRDKQGNMPLHIAVARCNSDAAELLIKKGSDTRATNLKGRTCAHMMNNRLIPRDFVENAILHGGQVNAVDELGNTPLHLALFSKDWNVVKYLLKHGSDPDARDYKGSTPLHAGCCSGNREAVSFAIDHVR